MDRENAARLLGSHRDATLAQIAALTADLDAVAAATAGSNVDDEHDPEGSTVAYEREQLAAVRAQATTHLAEIDAAVDRLAAGRYGACEGCGRQIGADRIALLPAARLCVTCAARAKR